VTAAGAGCRAAMDAERFLEAADETPASVPTPAVARAGA
jgi:hypothetical protein